MVLNGYKLGISKHNKITGNFEIILTNVKLIIFRRIKQNNKLNFIDFVFKLIIDFTNN